MDKLIIIDGNSIVNRAYYGMPLLSNQKGVVTNALTGFLNMLHMLLKNENPTHVAVAFDVGKKVFRHELYEDYKATRKSMDDALRTQMPLVRQVVPLLGITEIGVEGYEGDDILGTLATLADKNNMEVIIVSGDRDTFQLIDEHVCVYYPKKGLSKVDVVDLAHLLDEYGLTPAQVIDYKSLVGDKSDNIPGVEKIGDKTALKLLNEYGSLDQIYEHLADFAGKKLGEHLRNGKEWAFLSKELATIKTDVPLGLSIEDLKLKDKDIDALRTFYTEYELKKMLEGLPNSQKQSVSFIPEKGYELQSADECENLLNGDKLFVHMAVDKHQDLTGLYIRCDGKNYTIREDLDYKLRGAIGECLKNILADEQLEVYADDAKRVISIFARYGIQLDNICWDACISHYLLNPEQRSHDDETILASFDYLPLPEDPIEKHLFIIEAYEKIMPMMIQQLKDAGLYKLYQNVELKLAYILSDMESTGMRVNVNYLKVLKREYEAHLMNIEKRIYQLAGEEFKINSPKQLAEILFEKLDLPSAKKNKTGYSTSADVLENMRNAHPIIDEILEYRHFSKLCSTYVIGLLKLADENGRLYTTFNQTLTATGRLSSSDPNLQNIPIRTAEGKRIRQAFIPNENGHVLISADYSQIELRVLAHLSEDELLVKGFKNNEDIHKRTASEVFEIPLEQVGSDERRAAKAVNFGIIYGQTDYGLSKEIGVDIKAAHQYIQHYFERYASVRQWLDKTIEDVRKTHYTTTLLGRRRSIKDINSNNFNLRSFAERTAVNTPIQGSAADIIKLAMIACQYALAEGKTKSRMILQVHDELIFDAPPDEVGYVVQKIRQSMEEVLKLNVPLKVDVKIGFNWQEMEEV